MTQPNDMPEIIYAWLDGAWTRAPCLKYDQMAEAYVPKAKLDKAQRGIDIGIELNNEHLQEIEALKAEITRLKEANAWRPISEAPKNTKILLWVANAYGHGRTKTGIVDPDMLSPGVYSYWDDGERLGMHLESYATHYKPLQPLEE